MRKGKLRRKRRERNVEKRSSQPSSILAEGQRGQNPRTYSEQPMTSENRTVGCVGHSESGKRRSDAEVCRGTRDFASGVILHHEPFFVNSPSEPTAAREFRRPAIGKSVSGLQ